MEEKRIVAKEENRVRRIMTKDGAWRFVKANLYLFLGMLSRCVDGRYRRQESGAAPFAHPGGDAGDMMVAVAALRLLATKHSLKNIEELRSEVLVAVVEVVGGVKNFYFHTDEGRKTKGIARGCGHLSKAAIDPGAYGLERDDMEAIFSKLETLKSQGAHEIELLGEHDEQAVIVIDSEEYALHNRDEVADVFVYHTTLQEKRLIALSEKMKLILPSIIGIVAIQEALRRSCKRQLDATLTRLASGRPIFFVKVSPEKRIQITARGKVE